MPTLNKRELAAAAGIALATLDARIASDPSFPVLRRGAGKGDEWEFDEQAALTRLAELDPVASLSFSQQFWALRVIEKKRDLDLQARKLLVAADVSSALRRNNIALRNFITGLPALVGDEFGLTRDQQRAMRGRLEDALRQFVRNLREAGLPVGEATPQPALSGAEQET